MKALLVFLMVLISVSAFAEEPVYYQKERAHMVEYLKAVGIQNPKLLQAIGEVKRQEFLPNPKKAYHERSFKLGSWAVAASPFLTAMRLESLSLKPGEKILEIGTESGYQAAVMSKMGAEVYSIDIFPELGRAAKERLQRLGYTNINLKIGDGFYGWEEAAPFDAIVFACAPDDFPPRLVEQLKEGGRMVLSLGKLYGPQTLIYAWKENGRMKMRPLSNVKLPPMIGKIKE